MSSVSRAGASLVERDHELTLLRAGLDAALRGEGGMAWILGEAGIGKTTLARGVAREAADRGFRVLRARPGETDGQMPYDVLRQLLARTLRGLSQAERAELAGGPARHALDHLLSPAGAGSVAQGTMLASFTWLVDELAARDPLLLVVDDCQWADEDSLRFLAALGRAIAEMPALLLIAARPVAPAVRNPALASLLADRDATVLRPEPLSLDGVGRLLGVGDETVLTAAHDVTGGNPFLVVALGHLLATAGEAQDATAVRRVVPVSVVDSVTQRILGMSPEARALAEAVAILEAAPLRLAAELAALATASAETAADELRAGGLLAEGTSLIFQHALLGGAVLAAVSPSHREAMRRQAARLLAGEPEGRGSAAAQLLRTEGTGDPWAVTLLATQAREALASGAAAAAVTLLRRAVAEAPAPETRGEVVLALGLAELRNVDPACVGTLTEAIELMKEKPDKARAALALASAYAYAGFFSLAVETLEPHVDLLDGDLGLEVEATFISSCLLVPGRIDEARRRLAAHLDLPGATRGERLILIQQASNASATNQPASVIRGFAHRAIGDWATDDQQPESTEWAWARLFLAASGEYAEARSLADAALAASAESGSVLGFATASFVHGMASWWAGDLRGAEVDFRAMLDNAERLNGGMLVSTLALGGLGQTLAEQGRVEEALELLGRLPDELPSDAPPNGVAQILRARAIARQVAGDHEGALAAARECGRRVQATDADSPTWASWRTLAAPPLVALGRMEEARALLAEEHVLAERSEVPRILGLALRLAGELDGIAGLAQIEQAVDVLEGSGARLEQAKALFALGRCLRRSGRRAEAREPLARARALAAECGAGGLQEAVEIELQASGARPRRIAVTGPPRPSPRARHGSPASPPTGCATARSPSGSSLRRRPSRCTCRRRTGSSASPDARPSVPRSPRTPLTPPPEGVARSSHSPTAALRPIREPRPRIAG